LIIDLTPSDDEDILLRIAPPEEAFLSLSDLLPPKYASFESWVDLAGQVQPHQEPLEERKRTPSWKERKRAPSWKENTVAIKFNHIRSPQLERVAITSS
jgi:hypothetical protein